MAQLRGIQLDEELISEVIAALASPARPVSLDRARIGREMRALALDHVAGRMSDAAYLDRLGQLRNELAMLGEPATGRPDRAGRRMAASYR